MAIATRPEKQIVAECMAVAADLHATLARVADDKAFTTELIRAQRAGDEPGMQRLLHSTGSIAGLRIDAPEPGEAVAKSGMPKYGITAGTSIGPNGTTFTVGGSIQFRFGGVRADGPGPIGPPVLSPTIPEAL